MNSRWFWLMTTAAFVLTWFVFVPYLVSSPYVDLTAPMAYMERLTDNRGFSMTNDEARKRCLVAVYIAAMRVAAKHHEAPLDTPDRIYLQCMHDHKVLV